MHVQVQMSSFTGTHWCWALSDRCIKSSFRHMFRANYKEIIWWLTVRVDPFKNALSVIHSWSPIMQRTANDRGLHLLFVSRRLSRPISVILFSDCNRHLWVGVSCHTRTRYAANKHHVAGQHTVIIITLQGILFESHLYWKKKNVATKCNGWKQLNGQRRHPNGLSTDAVWSKSSFVFREWTICEHLHLHNIE